ncbi:hypothetical protein C0995_005536 [Termitomyces sp. Mi166|nr:hypothetical protein C0995_005536 [Termitomyces sp. Mi166\
MLGHSFAFSAAPIRKVKEVQFGILSPEEIPLSPLQKAVSVAKIEHPEVMDETIHRPKMGGLMDPRMGTIDRNFKCQTCGEGMSECPGHFGHIELARPVFHPDPREYLRKLREAESRYRELRYLFPTRFAPPPPNFLGALSTSHGEPQTRSTFVPLTIEGVLPARGGGSHSARFRSLDRRADSIASTRGTVGHEVAW